VEVNGQLHVLAALPLGKGPQTWYGCGGGEKNPYPCQESNPSCPACNLVITLSHPSSNLYFIEVQHKLNTADSSKMVHGNKKN